MSKNAICPVSQKLLTAISARASSLLITIFSFRFSPVSCRSCCYTHTSYQTSSSRLAVRFLTWLCLSDTKPPFLQLRAWSIEKVEPHSHFECRQSKLIASHSEFSSSRRGIACSRYNLLLWVVEMLANSFCSPTTNIVLGSPSSSEVDLRSTHFLILRLTLNIVSVMEAITRMPFTRNTRNGTKIVNPR